MKQLGLLLVVLPTALALYAYVGYPALLKLLGMSRGPGYPRSDPDAWPKISISLPAHNEEDSIRAAVESLLALDYPEDLLEIVVISDASTDGTDDIVREFVPTGVRLIRLRERGGKTAAENAAAPQLTGDIVVNTDATSRILPESLKALIRVFQDPTIGVASGRDVSVGAAGEAIHGEMGYVGYEMWVRSLETKVGSIVGASGCCYAIRRELHEHPVPPTISRDFLSALRAWEAGLRAVSVNEAICLVPRTGSIRVEFRRKIRTMARGLQTLWHRRGLMNPARHGLFAVALTSHKLCRWLVPLGLPLAGVGVVLLSGASVLARVLLVGGVLVVAGGGYAFVRSDGGKGPKGGRLLNLCGYLLASNLAAIIAWWRFLSGDRTPTWEPTRRQPVP